MWALPPRLPVANQNKPLGPFEPANLVIITTPSRLPTPIYADRLLQLLIKHHYDPNLSSFLWQGFTSGLIGHPISTIIPNLLSAQQYPISVQAKLSEELPKCRISGPYQSLPFPNFIVSPLRLVPKRAPGSYTFIIYHSQMVPLSTITFQSR